MRTYEMTVVLRANLSDDELEAQIETIQEWIAAKDGEIAQVDRWGRRKLAYPIKDFRDGYYLLYRVALPPAAPAEIERQLGLAENVLRYLFVREDE